MSDSTLVKENPNPFAVQGRESGGVAQRGSMMDAEVARGVAEVQGALVIAKKYPRSETEAYNRIMRACQRVKLADAGTYTYPKGDKTVTGPSIRLAEAISQQWGNIRAGVDEVEQHEDYSIVRAWAWDMETNNFESRTFTVRHEIQLKGGRLKKITDPREIYEMCANVGARRKRACILAVVPGDVVEAAVEACEATLAKQDGGIPIIERIRKMAVAFGEYGVTIPMIEKRFKHKLETISEQELVVLRGIYTSLKDGEGKIEQYFENASDVKAPEGLDKTAPATAPVTPPKTAPPAATPPPAAPANETAPVPTAPATTESKPSEAPAAEAEKQEEPKEPKPRAKKETPKGTSVAQLKNVMALEGISEGEVMEIAIRKHSAPLVKTLEEVGEAGCKTILDNWESISAQVSIDRKANES